MSAPFSSGFLHLVRPDPAVTGSYGPSSAVNLSASSVSGSSATWYSSYYQMDHDNMASFEFAWSGASSNLTASVTFYGGMRSGSDAIIADAPVLTLTGSSPMIVQFPGPMGERLIRCFVSASSGTGKLDTYVSSKSG